MMTKVGITRVSIAGKTATYGMIPQVAEPGVLAPVHEAGRAGGLKMPGQGVIVLKYFLPHSSLANCLVAGFLSPLTRLEQ
jgi:hypothetical protein